MLPHTTLKLARWMIRTGQSWERAALLQIDAEHQQTTDDSTVTLSSGFDHQDTFSTVEASPRVSIATSLLSPLHQVDQHPSREASETLSPRYDRERGLTDHELSLITPYRDRTWWEFLGEYAYELLEFSSRSMLLWLIAITLTIGGMTVYSVYGMIKSLTKTIEELEKSSSINEHNSHYAQVIGVSKIDRI